MALPENDLVQLHLWLDQVLVSIETDFENSGVL